MFNSMWESIGKSLKTTGSQRKMGVEWMETIGKCNKLPEGIHCDGKPPFSIGKSTINGN